MDTITNACKLRDTSGSCVLCFRFMRRCYGRFLCKIFLEVQKWTLFAPSVCDITFELPCTSVESYARLLRKNKQFTLFVLYGDHTYHVSGTGYQVFIASSSSQQVRTPILPLYENIDAVRIEPRPLCLNACRLCARSSRTFFSRTLFGPQASGDGTRMQGVLGESRASCRLSINSGAGSTSGSQQQQYEGFGDNS